MERSASLIVSANRRLAGAIRSTMQGRLGDDHGRIWASPVILPWNAWLKSLYDRLVTQGEEARALISRFAESLVWERLLAEDRLFSDHFSALNLAAVAEEIRRAWHLLCEYGLPIETLEDYPSAESECLLRVFTAYRNYLDRADLLDEAQLGARVLMAITADALTLPAQIDFIGFEGFSPQAHKVIAALRQRGCRVRMARNLGELLARECGPGRNEQAFVYCIPCADRAAEVDAALRWFEAFAEGRKAIVIPDLAACRAQVATQIESFFEPLAILPGRSPARSRYHLGMGLPLAQWPLVADALIWWRLAAGEAIEFSAVEVLLRSPFCALAEDEAEERAIFCNKLRDRARPMMTAEAIDLLGKNIALRCANPPQAWLQGFALFLDEVTKIRDTSRCAARWIEVLWALLKAVGWPGERSLNDDEMQVFSAFKDAVHDLVRLDLVQERAFTFRETFYWASRKLNQTRFQPESPGTAPIEVLGLSEAFGQEIDHLWIAGLGERTWPAQGRPNAFLPHEVQRSEGMPFARPDDAATRANKLVRGLLDSAKHAMVSYEEHQECGPSPLIVDLAPIDRTSLGADHAESFDNARLRYFGQGERSAYQDQQAPALVGIQCISGGSRVLADQARCPFRAFAQYRLGAQRSGLAQRGLDAATQGRVIHRALELIWRHLGTHEALCRAIEAKRLSNLITGAVNKALAPLAIELSDVLQPRLRELFSHRVCELLSTWLTEHESSRPPFSVAGQEQAVQIRVGAIVLDLRIDRVDHLADGSSLLIDYKTGSGISPAVWLKERLEEPQLPLYAIATGNSIAALAFARIRRGAEAGFSGISIDESILPKVKSRLVPRVRSDRDEHFEIHELLPRWRRQLESLAGEFAAGDAAPRPHTQACAACHLAGLCRRRDFA